jgi:uncharacterized protein (DUF2141 family)
MNLPLLGGEGKTAMLIVRVRSLLDNAVRRRAFARGLGRALIAAGFLLAARKATPALGAGEAQSTAQPPGRRDIVIIVRNVRGDRGSVRMALWDHADGFTKSKRRIAGDKAPAAPGEVRFVVPNMPFGRYAAAVYHDADNDGEMDRSWIGLPEEGLGFSNGAKIHYDVVDPGPPSFDEAAVVIDDSNDTIVVRLNY